MSDQKPIRVGLIGVEAGRLMAIFLPSSSFLNMRLSRSAAEALRRRTRSPGNLASPTRSVRWRISYAFQSSIWWPCSLPRRNMRER